MIFKILRDYKVTYLEDKVNELIKEGWKPVGSMTVEMVGSSAMFYYQNMLKEDEPSEPTKAKKKPKENQPS